MKKEYTTIIEDHDFTSEFKLKWFGYGEWVEEIDHFLGECSGYRFGIIRCLQREPCIDEEAYFGGHLNGYVRIPSNHPYFKKDISEMDLNVHGGITFSESFINYRWIGYDCAHIDDIIPTMVLLKEIIPEFKIRAELFPMDEELKKYPFFNPMYKNIEYNIQQCIGIIEQLILVKLENKVNEKQNNN